MTELKEIYQWYRQVMPEMPNNLTSIQKKEWENDTKKFLKIKEEKSFVGEDILCHAVIINITEDTIEASANYYGDDRAKLDTESRKLTLLKDTFYDCLHPHYNTRLHIHFTINYDKSTFYEKLKNKYVGDMIEFKCNIHNLNWSISEDNFYGPHFSLGLTINSSLLNIKKIKYQLLYADVLGENISSYKRESLIKRLFNRD